MRTFSSSLDEVLPGSVVSQFQPSDVAELVVLQRCCWVQEAILNDTLDIPALHEDGAAVLSWATAWTTIVVRLDQRLVAAVRGRAAGPTHETGPTWEIGRLMVAPDLQGHGLGAALLALIESLAPGDLERFELFTGGKSERNIRMYEQAGYALEAAADPPAPGHIAGAVYLSKPTHRPVDEP